MFHSYVSARRMAMWSARASSWENATSSPAHTSWLEPSVLPMTHQRNHRLRCLSMSRALPPDSCSPLVSCCGDLHEPMAATISLALNC